MAKLKKDFPGQPDLEAAGINTEKQLRDHIASFEEGGDWNADIPNVGDVTAQLIEEELARMDGSSDEDKVKADSEAPSRKLMAGTVLPFGDKRIRLLGNVEFAIEDGAQLSDGGFAGLLATSGLGNFQANIGQLAPARYNPSSGAYVPNECDTCGAVINGDDVAADCSDCVTKKAAETEEAKASKK